MDAILLPIRAVLSATPLRWAQLTETLPHDLLTLAPAPGEWSALACLQHLVDTERWAFPVRLQALLNGQDFPASDPDTQGTPPNMQQRPADLAAEFTRLRNASLADYAAITTADFSRQARHAELGIVKLSELINEWAAHDLMHTMQAERALMQPFIRGCGPWLPYFVEHLAGSVKREA